MSAASPTTGRLVTRAGAAYAALWIAVIAARSCFSIGAVHWFNHPLATWMASHQVTGAAITDTLIIMAVAMTLARTLSLAVRANQFAPATPRSSPSLPEPPPKPRDDHGRAPSPHGARPFCLDSVLARRPLPPPRHTMSGAVVK